MQISLSLSTSLFPSPVSPLRHTTFLRLGLLLTALFTLAHLFADSHVVPSNCPGNHPVPLLSGVTQVHFDKNGTGWEMAVPCDDLPDGSELINSFAATSRLWETKLPATFRISRLSLASRCTFRTECSFTRSCMAPSSMRNTRTVASRIRRPFHLDAYTKFRTLISTGMSGSLTIEMHTEKSERFIPFVLSLLGPQLLTVSNPTSSATRCSQTRAPSIRVGSPTAGYRSGKSEGQTVGGQAR